jgi:hypothetical protein
MSETPEGTLRNLLLRRLSAEQSEQLEERLLLEGEVADQLEAEENDLLDDFARGRLSAEDAVRIEKYLLASKRGTQRAAFARALSRISNPESRALPARSFSSRLRIPALALGSAACVLVIAFAALHVWHKESPDHPGPGTPTATKGPLTMQKNSSQAKITLPFAIVLLAGVERGDHPLKFAIPSDVQQVQFQCEIPAGNAYSEYRMVLRDAAGNAVAASENLHPGESSGIAYVEATVDAARLGAGRFSVSISPEESPSAVTSFQFVVQRSAR